MLSLSSKIEFVKFLKQKFLGKKLRCLEVLCVVECTMDFGTVTNIDFADDKVSVWGEDMNVFWIKLDDIIRVDFAPKQEDVCLEIEAQNEVKVLFYLDE
ncbi:hypothetical protein Desaci_1951 [Desulfosporosinus acidiphilus SJ4]|uniref:Uncharacterized protein n=1 Tax=Desulfosporosinus acidiphilus (strain DSM 22704 / JCM 16185 / SJ4) TaxID=646529 RepID=I4D554_DESAJ|nr:hypothetical protein [Desulfosporosinus acidiphilus]AFM40928.1 hypothetical protein Desaci_1951 [Desulfosporosinus acidiphilus SJ4]